jgi:hypothetical protein
LKRALAVGRLLNFVARGFEPTTKDNASGMLVVSNENQRSAGGAGCCRVARGSGTHIPLV